MIEPSFQPAHGAKQCGRRHHSRLRLHLPATIITLDGTASATLLDLSCSGASLGTAQLLHPGCDVVLQWASHEAFGTVRWANASTCGIEFEEPIGESTVLETRRLAPPPSEHEQVSAAARTWVWGRAAPAARR